MVPLLLLSALEALLRVASFGYPATFYLRSSKSGQPVFVDNAMFGRRFFTPPELARKPLSFVLPAEKAKNTYRIVLLGESAAVGDPNPAFGCARILERMLCAEYPGVRFEVLNAGMVAINSHVIRPIARDCARLQPDAFIVYMGHNEVVGPYGPGTAFHAFSPSLAYIRAGIFVRGTRAGQLIDALIRLPARAKDRISRWNGMQMFLEHRIRADDPRLTAAYRHFERNLDDIVASAEDVGARVVLCTVGANLRTSPPFGSAHRVDLSATSLATWERHDAQGRRLESQGDIRGALASYLNALQIDGTYAELVFRIARCRERLGETAGARQSYEEALNQDTLRFRADPGINGAIRRTADAHPGRVALLDAEQVFARNSEHGIPGDDLFLEHVHMNFRGNYVLAKALVDALAAQFPGWVTQRHAPDARLAEADCARLLAFTAWDQFALDEGVYRRLGTPPFSFQLDHEARSAAMARHLDSRRGAAAGPAGLEQARQGYAYALAKAPDDWLLHQGLGNMLIAAGDMAGALREYRRVFEAIPQAMEPYMREAFERADVGQPEEAVALITAHNPDRPLDLADVYNDMGETLSANGDHARAAELFKKALNLEPDNAGARYNLAMALAQQGRPAEAIAGFQSLLALDPNNADAHYNFAMALARSAQWDEALRHLRRTIEIDPGDADAHMQAAVILRQLRDPAGAEQHLRASLQIRPDFAMARELLDAVRAEQEKGGQAGQP
ncbi:MAG: tetratricopeptide repeat protein [Pseudomonadota bacterium]